MSFGKITVTYPDGRKEELPLDKATVRIGRSPENDLVLEDERVSRHHADILFDDESGLSILDTGSANGVRVDGVRLVAWQSTPLDDRSEIEIGRIHMGVSLQIEAVLRNRSTTSQRPTTPPARQQEESYALSELPAQPEPINMILNKTDLKVNPGQDFPFSVTVENHSDVVDKVSLDIEGIPTTWYTIMPESRSLFPLSSGKGISSDDFGVIIHPPRAPDSIAKTYDCRFIARSREFPDRPTVLSVPLTVNPYIEFESSIKPRKITGLFRGAYWIEIANKSNTSLHFMLNGEDDEGVLIFDFNPPDPEIAAGAEQRIHTHVRSDRRWPFGKQQIYQFTNTITPMFTGVEQQQQHPGTLVQRLLPPWLLLALLLLLLLIPLLLLSPTIIGLLRPPVPEPFDGRQITFVQQGTIERTTQVPGQVVPINIMPLAFGRDGVVSTVNFTRGQVVTANAVIAELRPVEQLLAIRAAEDNLARARRELENAKAQQSRDAQQAQLDVEQAQQAAEQVAPGGPNDPARQAAKDLADTQTAEAAVKRSGSAAKLAAEDNLRKATEAVQEAQLKYSKAYLDNDWVQRKGTDPNTSTVTTVEQTGDTKTVSKQQSSKLNDVQKQAFKDALASASHTLSETEKAVVTAQQELDRAREDEIDKNNQADASVQEAQHKLDDLNKSGGSPAFAAAQRAAEAAQIKLDAVKNASLEPQLKAVEDAQRALDLEREKYPRGQIVAPKEGRVIAVSTNPGAGVKELAPVIQFAVPKELEVTAELNADQAASLKEGSQVTVTLTKEITATTEETEPTVKPERTKLIPKTESTQPITETGTIRQITMPITSTNGTAQDQKRVIHVQVTGDRNLTLDTSARVTMQLEHKDNAFWLPPPFVREDGARRYIVICEEGGTQTPASTATATPEIMQGCKSKKERRVDVKVGIETTDQVEIVSAFSDKGIEDIKEKKMMIISP